MSYEKHTWVNNEAITASKMNNIEDGIEEASQSGGGGGISNFDGYDYVISQVDSGTPVLEKGVWADVYDALQDMKTVVGLYVWNSTPNEYHNTQSMCLPLTFTFYYDSIDVITGEGLYYEGGTRAIEVDWNSPDTIVVTRINP